MKKLSSSYPTIAIAVNREETTSGVFNTLSSLIDVFTKFRGATVEVMNFNSIAFVSQAAAPTLVNGEAKLWEDSNATTGNPTHYLVFKDTSGTQVTFASQELVP